MSFSRQICCFTILAVVLLSGCTIQRSSTVRSTGDLPETVYVTPESRFYGTPYRIAVFRFMEPNHYPGTGTAAARWVVRELQDSQAFAEVIPEFDEVDFRLEHLADIAFLNRYQFFVTGEVLRLHDGGISGDSQVDQTVQVYRMRGRKPTLIWSAMATESAPSARPMDLVVLHVEGAPAPSVAALMKRNAEKVRNMIVTRLTRRETQPE